MGATRVRDPVTVIRSEVEALHARNVQRPRDAKIIVVRQVASRAEAQAADHAGTQVLIVQGVEAGDPVHWRARPPRKTATFHDKAIADIPTRLVFFNRGQGQVVRKAEALRPAIRGEPIRAETRIDGAMSDCLVRDFYVRIRDDAMPGPTLVAETAREVCPPAATERLIHWSQRVGECREPGIANGNGVLLNNGQRYFVDAGTSALSHARNWADDNQGTVAQ